MRPAIAMRPPSGTFSRTQSANSRTTGSANTFSYTHDGHRGDLVWLFDDEVLCTFNASSGGSLLVDGVATDPSRWFDRRSAHTVTAVADDGYDFAYMTVDGAVVENATVSLDCTEPHVVVATFLLAAGSADPASDEGFLQGGARAWKGCASAVIARECGPLRITASAEGLPDAQRTEDRRAY